MRQVILLIALAATVGCLRQTAFHCETDADCGSGTCEVVGYCSFADSECPDGRRYGELSGPHAGKCIGATDMPDASFDSGFDAEIDAPPNQDTDSDGVLNATDNCQTIANANQFNEDGDALGDVCDPCPVSANNADADSDGVGDACDPRPAMGGDVLEVFEGFHQGVPTSAGWAMTGTWTAATGSVSVNAASGSTASISRTFTTSSHETVSTSFTVLAANGTLPSAGPVTHAAQGGTGSIVCALYRYMGNPGITILDIANVNGATSAAYEMTLNETYGLSIRRDLAAYSCTGTRAATTGTVMGNYNVNYTPYSGGIFASGTSARFHWLMIVRNP
jgi:hypothetical protein